MIKHWKISHPELEEPPKFNIKVVASFRDPPADSSVRPSGLTSEGGMF